GGTGHDGNLVLKTHVTPLPLCRDRCPGAPEPRADDGNFFQNLTGSLLKAFPFVPRRAPSAGKRELRRSWDCRRSLSCQHNVGEGPARTATTAFSIRHARPFSSAKHWRSELSKLKLSPIFAAARQPGSTSKAGTPPAPDSAPPIARSNADGSIFRSVCASGCANCMLRAGIARGPAGVNGFFKSGVIALSRKLAALGCSCRALRNSPCCLSGS